jgi:cyanophycinase
MTFWSRPAGLAFCAALAACSGGSGGTDGATGVAPGAGRLVIVGGALDADNAEVYQAIVDGRDGDGPLCVLPTASGVPESSMASAVATLRRYVGDTAAIGVFLTEDSADAAADPGLVRRIEACSGYFFTGGDQSRVVDTFLPAGDTTRAFRALLGRWRAGAVVSGSSAGAAMMSGVMIASGSSAGAVQHGVVPRDEDDGVWIRRGLGFFDRAILDQHFLARGRVGRLIVAVLATDSLPVGLGIDENTALVVDGDSARVVGASGVVLVDARSARVEGGRWGRGVRLTLAGSGDEIDLRTFEVTRGPGKAPLGIDGSAPDIPPDPFQRWAFLHLLSSLAASGTSHEAAFDLDGGALTVREGAGFSAARETGDGVQGEPAGLSAGPFVIDLLPADTAVS